MRLLAPVRWWWSWWCRWSGGLLSRGAFRGAWSVVVVRIQPKRNGSRWAPVVVGAEDVDDAAGQWTRSIARRRRNVVPEDETPTTMLGAERWRGRGVSVWHASPAGRSARSEPHSALRAGYYPARPRSQTCQREASARCQSDSRVSRPSSGQRPRRAAGRRARPWQVRPARPDGRTVGCCQRPAGAPGTCSHRLDVPRPTHVRRACG